MPDYYDKKTRSMLNRDNYMRNLDERRRAAKRRYYHRNAGKIRVYSKSYYWENKGILGEVRKGDPVQRSEPLLDCGKCKRDTRHRFDAVTADGSVMYRCKGCNTQRRWGWETV